MEGKSRAFDLEGWGKSETVLAPQEKVVNQYVSAFIYIQALSNLTSDPYRAHCSIAFFSTRQGGWW